jgi:hypothetical protein
VGSGPQRCPINRGACDLALAVCGLMFCRPWRRTGSKYNMVHGITITGISRPVEKTADWTYYHTLDFAQTTGWDEFEDLLAS